MPETTSLPRRGHRRLRVVAILSTFSALLAFAASRSTIDTEIAASPVVTLIQAHREAEASAMARGLLDRSERDYGPQSLKAAEAIDEVIAAAAAIGERRAPNVNRRVAERAIPNNRR